MHIPNLDDEKATKQRKKFWRRQFQREPTKAQRKFDWTFGVIMPVICFFFDPIFFSSPSNDGIFGIVKPFTYLLSFTAIIAMMAWLIWGERLMWLSALLAGLFLVSGGVALAIGMCALPFSLFGLMIVIGVLGFTPLVTGIVYLRNGVRAINGAKTFVARNTLAYSILLSSLASIVIPYVINVEINRSIERIETGDANTIRSEGRKLRLVRPLVDTRSLARRYYIERGPEMPSDETKAIVDVYRDLTGRDIGSEGFTAILWKLL